jgi:hypothetical protein
MFKSTLSTFYKCIMIVYRWDIIANPPQFHYLFGISENSIVLFLIAPTHL